MIVVDEKYECKHTRKQNGKKYDNHNRNLIIIAEKQQNVIELLNSHSFNKRKEHGK